MKPERHITTRRGFVATLGFGGVSLYGLWAAYGAAPNPLTFLTVTPAPATQVAEGEEMQMAGHGGMESSTNVETFREEVARFIDQFGEPDGTVYPKPMAHAPEPSGMDMAAMEMEGMAMPMGAAAPHEEPADEASPAPVDVLLLAERYYFDPPALRLDLGQAYRFRMLAADVTHGASIQFGEGARMIRLGAGAETELEVTFTRPGSFLVYCTSYCGPGHDGMQARITVA